MDVVATIRNRILAIDAVRALVAGRVYASHLPQTPTYPSVIVQSISPVPASHLRGGDTGRTRVQVTSVAQTRELAVAVDAAIQGDNAGSGLPYWYGAMGSPSANIKAVIPDMGQEFYDPGVLRQYRINRDYWVHHDMT